MAMVKCSECKKEKSDTANVCPHCGYYEANNKTNALAIAGFISSFFFHILGLILSIVGLIQINSSKEQGKGLAIAGIIISAVSIFLGLVFFFLFFIFAAAYS